MKRCWKVILPSGVSFVMILMEDCDPMECVQSIWHGARVE